MANYSNIDVKTLKNTITNLINSINYGAINNALDTFWGSNYWQSKAKGVFTKALNDQKQINYQKLKRKLEDYLTIANYISAWQELYNKNQDLKSKRDAAYKNINTTNYKYKKDENGDFIYDRWGNKVTEPYNVYSNYWNNQYNSYKNTIDANQRTMNDYETKINSLI